MKHLKSYRIVYLTPATFPSRSAKSIHIMKMCQAFAQNGHRVTLVTADKNDSDDADFQDVFSYYGVDRCFDMRRIPWMKLKSIRRIVFAIWASLMSRRFKPDIVYTRCIFCCYFSTLLGLDVIFEAHTPMEEKKRIQKSLFHKTIRSPRLRKIVVITQALKKHFKEKYTLKKELLCVAPDGADPVSNQALPTMLPKKGSRLQIGYLGHLYKGKGFEEVVSRLPLLCPWADFHVVGGTHDILDIYRQKYKEVENLTLHGYIPHSQTSQYLLAFDLVLLPNQNSMYTTNKERDIARWTSPLKLFEYMAAGKPIIASDLPVLREILKHEYNALLCPPNDIKAWKLAIERLQDKALRQKLGRTAHNEFMAKYTWKKRAEKIIDCISEHTDNTVETTGLVEYEAG